MVKQGGVEFVNTFIEGIVVSLILGLYYSLNDQISQMVNINSSTFEQFLLSEQKVAGNGNSPSMDQ